MDFKAAMDGGNTGGAVSVADNLPSENSAVLATALAA
jgi:hypothetical protein